MGTNATALRRSKTRRRTSFEGQITTMNRPKAVEKRENIVMVTDSQSAIFAETIHKVRLESQLKMEFAVQGIQSHPVKTANEIANCLTNLYSPFTCFHKPTRRA